MRDPRDCSPTRCILLTLLTRYFSFKDVRLIKSVLSSCLPSDNPIRSVKDSEQGATWQRLTLSGCVSSWRQHAEDFLTRPVRSLLFPLARWRMMHRHNTRGFKITFVFVSVVTLERSLSTVVTSSWCRSHCDYLSKQRAARTIKLLQWIDSVSQTSERANLEISESPWESWEFFVRHIWESAGPAPLAAHLTGISIYAYVYNITIHFAVKSLNL